jgi:hypothetical protein
MQGAVKKQIESIESQLDTSKTLSKSEDTLGQKSSTTDVTDSKKLAEAVVIAVAEDNVNRFRAVLAKLGPNVLPNLRFEHDMNVLNLALD